MCGIIGYTGQKPVKNIILDSLELLEYRGYDSAGVAAVDESLKKTDIFKCAGRVSDLRKLCDNIGDDTTCGIGHTRWATHGGVTDANAHPHQFGNVTLVHNGIIENYKELAAEYDFTDKLKSNTDSEIAAAVFDYFYKGDAIEAIRQTISKLKGTFAFVILFNDQPGTIYAVRNVSPIVAAYTKDGAILASDVTAIGNYTKEYFVVPEYTILSMNKTCLNLITLDGSSVEPEMITINWELNISQKGGYPFYMEKEIHEQPKVIEQILKNQIRDGLPNFSEGNNTNENSPKQDCFKQNIPCEMLKNCTHIYITACGTAMHAGLIGASLIRDILHLPVSVELASEFMYMNPAISDKTLVIVVSQSGETIDTLEALRYSKKHGAKVLSIVNVRGSSIARESDAVLYTNAGPEIAVASTKAYTTQLATFSLLIAHWAYITGKFSKEQTKEYLNELKKVPDAMQAVLDKKEQIHHIADKIINAHDIFMIGRGIDYAIAREASLKLKEVSYIHSEAYASGELKHGPLALITEHTPIVAAVTQEQLLSKEISNLREVKSRGADIILFTKISLEDRFKNITSVFTIPDLKDEFMCMPAAVALQLLAYYVSLDKGYDVDKPRNLAKVVTVE